MKQQYALKWMMTNEMTIYLNILGKLKEEIIVDNLNDILIS